ncbi:IPT/TIG domain-containing protein [Streptomyces coffeae]|uniref:IPT/TIG domain-containing protein n=1 Tax=Streptomyces coffeae TaxID=621382 RepID=A0ABS1NP66_9ACTN|nr:IPT/TIG domain-containing protein [Streptomyces coffeae]MBL1101881.1 hypothetical protein [Streptomyces coffeae]
MATITSLSPTQGKVGDTVTINGTALTGTIRVNFGSAAVTPTGVTATTVTFVVPASAPCAGQVSVSVTSNAGATSNARPFFVLASPTTTGLDETCVAAATGGPLTVFGSGFASGGSVTVSGLAPVAFAAGGNNSEVTVTVPADGAQAVCIAPHNVTVTTPGGTSTAGTTVVDYYNPPTLTAATATPATGTGSDEITISGGTCLNGVTAVTFTDSAAATFSAAFQSVSETTLVVTVPTGTATGAGTFTVTTCGGTSDALAFTVT